MPRYYVGSELIDTTDGQTVVVSEISRRGSFVRKRSPDGEWNTLRYSSQRFVRRDRFAPRTGRPPKVQPTRAELLAKYGEEVVRLAEGLDLKCEEVAEMRNDASGEAG